MKPARALLVASLGAGVTYLLAATGALGLDVNVGRRVRPLGPLDRAIAAPPEVVFDVIAEPYLSRTTRALAAKLQVLERGADLVLAAHYTPIGLGLKATTVETVRFERPSRVGFRLVRGPVPHVLEAFELSAHEAGTAFWYHGEIGADFWGLGEWWAKVVGARWERAVERSVAGIAEEAERRAARASRS